MDVRKKIAHILVACIEFKLYFFCFSLDFSVAYFALTCYVMFGIINIFVIGKIEVRYLAAEMHIYIACNY